MAFLFSTLLGGEALGQSTPQVSFDRIDLSEIEYADSIAAICQDRRGFMWFGCGNGLIRFDGARTKVFRHDPDRPGASLVDNTIWEIFEDRDGFLWIGTNQGISRFDPVREVFTNFREDLEDPNGLRGTIGDPADSCHGRAGERRALVFV